MQPRLRNPLQAGIVPQCAVVHNTTMPKSAPASFNAARMQPCNCVWNGDGPTSFLFLLTLPLGPAPLAVFLLDGFRRTFLDLFAHQLFCDQSTVR